MSNLRQAAQQALEALEKCSDWPGAYDARSHAVHNLRAALAEPEQPVAYVRDQQNPCYMFTVLPSQQHQTQEPVAKVCHDLPGHIGWNPRLTRLPDEGTYLFAAPAPRKPLPEAMKARFPCAEANPSLRGAYYDGWMQAEAAHGITGETK